MNFLKWSKSFLLIYNLIPSIVEGIDNLVLAKGVNSAQFYGTYAKSTFKQAEGIINLTEKKVNLINLKVLMDETLLEMKEENSKILILRYVDGICPGDIMQALKLSRRTYFRRVNSALGEFRHIISLKFFNNKNVWKLFRDENLLDDIFERITVFNSKIKDDDNIDKYADSICGLVLNKLKKVLWNFKLCCPLLGRGWLSLARFGFFLGLNIYCLKTFCLSF